MEQIKLFGTTYIDDMENAVNKFLNKAKNIIEVKEIKPVILSEYKDRYILVRYCVAPHNIETVKDILKEVS